MADRHRYEGYGSDRDRWRERDREPGWRDDERRSWASEDYGRGREGGAYGQGAWRGAGQRSIQQEDQRWGAHRDTGDPWGPGRSHRDQMGREDFGQYGQTGAGGDYGYGRERYSRGAMGQGYGQTRYDQPRYEQPSGAAGRDMSGDDYGHAREGRGQRPAAGQGMTYANTHGDFEPDYLHWRNTQMQKLDQEYLRWREERRSKFAKDFDEWRRDQGGRQGQPAATGQMQTAGQGSSGGLPDQAGGREEKKKKS